MLLWFEVSNVIHIASMNSNLSLLLGSHFGLQLWDLQDWEDSPQPPDAGPTWPFPGVPLFSLTLPPKKLKSWDCSSPWSSTLKKKKITDTCEKVLFLSQKRLSNRKSSHPPCWPWQWASGPQWETEIYKRGGDSRGLFSVPATPTRRDQHSWLRMLH